ncbi:hypothetical protein JNW88_12135 [Micromonospora sp. ATA32]|nr:hypothetical protein [Micromonospora sp. ATA32]
MLIVRATKKLLDRIGPPSLRDGEQSTTRLGQWYGTRLAWRPDVVLLVNELTLLPVLIRLAPTATVLPRGAHQIATVLAAHGAPGTMIAEEFQHMRTQRVGTTANRSVVGIMNEFTRLADVYRDHEPSVDLNDLAARLATTPCSPLYRTHITPERAFAAFLHSAPT